MLFLIVSLRALSFVAIHSLSPSKGFCLVTLGLGLGNLVNTTADTKHKALAASVSNFCLAKRLVAYALVNLTLPV